MLKIERILCPVDFSEFSEKAFDYAYSLARRYEARLFLEHVISPFEAAYPHAMVPDGALVAMYGELTVNAEKRLTEMVKKYPSNGLKPDCAVQRGFVVDTILTSAEEQSADLIVMGTHGRRGWDRLMMGSVTERIVRKAQCPVLAVRQPAHDFIDPKQPQDAFHLKKILFCTDFSENSLVALEYALSLAQEYQAELTLLHVLDGFPPQNLKAETQEAEHKLLRPIPPEVFEWCTLKTAVRPGMAYREIIKLAQQDQTDLIVLGVLGRNVVDLAIFGSTTHRVLQLSPCPVLAVHMQPSE